MTDEHDGPLTGEQDEQVRRLLAGARHDEPMPPDVVARLDRVLDDLAAEPARRAPVVDLAKRRRRATSMLVAAAAVVVVGVGIGQVGGLTSGDDQGDASVSADREAGGSSDSSGADGSTKQQRSDAEEAAPSAESPQAGNGAGRFLVQGKSFAVDPGELSRDLRKVQQYAERSVARDDLARLDDGSLLSELDSCRTPGLGPGTYVSIRYGDQPAVLVLRAPEGETQVADVYLCGSRDPVRSLTLRLPPP